MATFYADENFDGKVTKALRSRGVDILTIQEDGRSGLAPDSLVMDRATELNRVLLTHDDDLLAEAHRRQDAGQHFSGVIFMAQDDGKRRRYIEELEMRAFASDTDEYVCQVVYC
jgi:predicted nuclease of predicted toxin-antitoxin system